MVEEGRQGNTALPMMSGWVATARRTPAAAVSGPAAKSCFFLMPNTTATHCGKGHLSLSLFLCTFLSLLAWHWGNGGEWFTIGVVCLGIGEVLGLKIVPYPRG